MLARTLLKPSRSIRSSLAPTISSLQPLDRRHQSSESTSSRSSYLPSPSQIYAIPFASPPSDARERLDWFSIPASYSALSGATALLARFVPFLGIKSQIQRVGDVVPIYLPCWSVDGEIKAKATWSGLGKGSKVVIIKAGSGGMYKDELKAGDEEDMPSVSTNATLSTEWSFFPGTSYAPLSHLSLPFILPQLPEALPLYNPERHLSQYNMDIKALPFDTSPLVLPTLLSQQRKVTALSWSVDTDKDLEWKKLEATPLYMPLYLAKYKVNGREYTLAMLANDSSIGDSEILIPPPPKLADRPGMPPFVRVKGTMDKDLKTHMGVPFVARPEIDLPDCSKTARSDEPASKERLTKEIHSHMLLQSAETLPSLLHSWLNDPDARRHERIRDMTLEGPDKANGVSTGVAGVGKIVPWVGAMQEEEGREEEEEEDEEEVEDNEKGRKGK